MILPKRGFGSKKIMRWVHDASFVVLLKKPAIDGHTRRSWPIDVQHVSLFVCLTVFHKITTTDVTVDVFVVAFEARHKWYDAIRRCIHLWTVCRWSQMGQTTVCFSLCLLSVFFSLSLCLCIWLCVTQFGNRWDTRLHNVKSNKVKSLAFHAHGCGVWTFRPRMIRPMDCSSHICTKKVILLFIKSWIDEIIFGKVEPGWMKWTLLKLKLDNWNSYWLSSLNQALYTIIVHGTNNPGASRPGTDSPQTHGCSLIKLISSATV